MAKITNTQNTQKAPATVSPAAQVAPVNTLAQDPAQIAPATFTRVTLSAANKERHKLRAVQALKTPDLRHVSAAYSTQVSILKAPTDTPADIDGEAAHTFAPVDSFAVLPLSYFCRSISGFDAAIDTLRAAFDKDGTSNRQAVAAFLRLFERFNAGDVPPFAEIAGRTLFRGYKRMTAGRDSATSKIKVRDTLRQELAKALYFAHVGQVEEPATPDNKVTNKAAANK